MTTARHRNKLVPTQQKQRCTQPSTATHPYHTESKQSSTPQQASSPRAAARDIAVFMCRSTEPAPQRIAADHSSLKHAAAGPPGPPRGAPKPPYDLPDRPGRSSWRHGGDVPLCGQPALSRGWANVRHACRERRGAHPRRQHGRQEADGRLSHQKVRAPACPHCTNWPSSVAEHAM